MCLSLFITNTGTGKKTVPRLDAHGTQHRHQLPVMIGAVVKYMME